MKAQRTILEKALIHRLATSLERAPWSTCRRVGTFFGLAFFYGFRHRRHIATSNLRLVFPHLSEAQVQVIARRSAQNFGMSFCEFLHLRTASEKSLREYADIEGMEHVEKALSHGRGMVLPTAHFGAWEVMAARVALDFPLTVIVRLTSNQTLREHILRVREAIDVQMIDKSDSARAPLKVLKKNGGLGIFPDQHAGKDGALMPVFGHPTRVFTSTSRLALSARAPLIPGFAVRRKPWISDGRVTVKIRPGLYLHENEYSTREESVMAGTRFIVSETENIIRQYPDQWLWMHRRWREEDQRAQDARDEQDERAQDERAQDERDA